MSVYFALAETDQIVQRMTRGEIFAATDMEDTIKSYALKALSLLSVESDR